MIGLMARFVLLLLVALILTIIPLPAMLAPYRPFWVLLFVLYIQFFLPNYFSVIWLALVGLILDILLYCVLGEHAFALLFVCLLAANKARRFAFFSIIQQMLLIACFCLLYAMLLVLIDFCVGYPRIKIIPLESALISILFWPWMKLLGDHVLSAKRLS